MNRKIKFIFVNLVNQFGVPIYVFMKSFSFFYLLFIYINSYGQVLLKADGVGNTYNLINSVLAPGYNSIEVPDCNHGEFGDHIDEIFDSELNTTVFRFHIHTTPDNDRCKNFDRQRNEIKTYDKSPDNLLGTEDETIIYKWKFKLETGFQSSSNFTHLHQLKSVGGLLESIPMYTLTTRKGDPDQLELRYAETNAQVTLLKKDISLFIGTWLQVTETIKYGVSGTYHIKIESISDNTTLLSYTNNSIINWREGADFVRPKWGIYRSLNNSQDLRDETLLFADFSIEEIDLLSVIDSKKETFTISPNPVKNILYLKKVPQNVNLIQIFTLEGRQIINKTIDPIVDLKLDVSALEDGTYILNLVGKQLHQSKLIIISNK